MGAKTWVWIATAWLLLVVRAGNADPQMTPAPEPTPDRRPLVLVLLAPEAFQEHEWQVVTAALSGRARLAVASTQPGTAHGTAGGTVWIGYTLERVRPEQVDGLVLLGGPGAKTYLWFDPQVRTWVQTLDRLHRPIGALDVAAVALANAGVLRGRAATVLPTPDGLKLFERNQVRYRAQSLVVDETLVTAASPAAAAGFAAAFGQLLPRRTRAQGDWPQPLPTPPPRRVLKVRSR
jgi:protease I